MKDLTLFTNRPLTHEEAGEILKRRFKNKKIIYDTANYLYMGNKPTQFTIDFTPTDRFSNIMDGYSETFRKQVPIDDPYVTCICYDSFVIAKQIVEVLLSIFPELYVHDDSFMWLGSGFDFINSNHQNKNSNYKGRNYKDED